MIEQTLHGLVVGLGKIRKDGSKEFHWLDKPIHNRIVSGGLDEYFMFNGSTTGLPQGYQSTHFINRFLSNSYESSYIPYNGVLQYIAIGTDNTPTSFNDSTLHAQVGGYSREYTYITLPYFGNCVSSSGDTVSFRVQNTSIAVENDVTIKEIGWFEKYTTSDTYVMFSRVVLPTPVQLLAGEKLTVVYQMNVSYNTEETETSQSILSGLLDSDGNQLRGTSSYRLYFGRNVISFDTWYLPNYGYPLGSFFGVGTANSETKIIGAQNVNGRGYYLSSPFNSYKNNVSVITYTTDPNWNMAPQFSKIDSGSGGGPSDCYLTENAANVSSITPKNYTIGSYYRDNEITVSPSWPSMSSGYQDIYAINYNGLLTRFGHYDNTDPDNPIWVPKPWRKQFGQSYKFTFRYKLSTADTV